jgi:rubredoxin
MSTQPILLNVTAQQASQAVGEYKRGMKNARRLPALSPMLQKISDEQQLYIHNVGPWPCTREMGSWGSYTIPACPAGQEYATGAPIPGIHTEPIPINEKEFMLHETEGAYVAQQILGVGAHMSKSGSFVQLGCFSSPNRKPTKEELATAREALMQHAMKLHKEALVAHNKGPKEAEMVISDRHQWAAVHSGNQDAPYLRQYSPEQRQECPNCGTMSKQGIVICSACKYIFDEAKYAKMKSRIAQ